MSKLDALKMETDSLLDVEALFPVSHSWTEISSGSRRVVQDRLYKKSEKLKIDYPPEINWLSNFYQGRDKYSNKLRSPFRCFLGIISKELSKTSFKKLVCDDLKEWRTELYKNSTTKNHKFHTKFTRNVNWTAGTFGENSKSCYWGGRNVARAMIAANEGFAIQFFSDEQGKVPFGRCWGVYIKDRGLVIWNAYTKQSTDDRAKNSAWLDLFAMALAKKFNLQSKRIFLSNYGSTTGNLYINNEEGYVIGESKTLNKITKLDFGWSDDVSTWTCRDCNAIIVNQEELIEVNNGRLICEVCAEKNYDICNYNMSLYLKDNLVMGPDNKKYSLDNIRLVRKFVYSIPYSKYIMKDQSVSLGLNYRAEEIFLPNTDNRILCSHCHRELISTNETICVECKYDNEYLQRKLNKEYFVFSSDTSNWTDVIDKKYRYRLGDI